MFLGMNVTYLAKSVFKPLLKNSLNSIFFPSPGLFSSKIDCDDCRNYWLIKKNKENQVKYTKYTDCIANNTLTLFDEETKTKLSKKCK